MSNIKTLKGYDEYGYEIMNIDCGISAIDKMSECLINYGLTVEEAVERLRQIPWIFDKFAEIENYVENNRVELNKINSTKADKSEVHGEISLLRSELDDISENLKQKVDLEIFEQKVPEEENMFLRGI